MFDYIILVWPGGRKQHWTLKFSIGNEGDSGSWNSEMEKMSDQQTVFIPPVHLDSLDDFKEVASEAAVIVYNPEFFCGPFTDGEKKIRRLTLSAVGVIRNGVPLTFRFVIDDVRDLERVAAEILRELQTLGNVVRGSVESPRPIGELLAAWP